MNLKDCAVVTRHQVATNFFVAQSTNCCALQLVANSKRRVKAGIYAQVKLVNMPSSSSIGHLHFFSMHLAWAAPGVEAAYNRLVTDNSTLDAIEAERLANVNSLLQEPEYKNRDSNSTILVVGDFNSPSHQDWIDSARQVLTQKICITQLLFNFSHLHANLTYAWPATLTITRQGGMQDSYRAVHPSPVEHPGLTWSTVKKRAGYHDLLPEPQGEYAASIADPKS